MPNKTVKEILIRLDKMEKSVLDHLIESGGIKTRLDVNTFLTGIILVALLTKFVVEWFKH